MLNGSAISRRHRLQTLPFHPGGGPEQPGAMSKGLWDLVILPTRPAPKGPFRPTRAAWCEPGRDRAARRGFYCPGISSLTPGVSGCKRAHSKSLMLKDTVLEFPSRGCWDGRG